MNDDDGKTKGWKEIGREADEPIGFSLVGTGSTLFPGGLESNNFASTCPSCDGMGALVLKGGKPADLPVTYLPKPKKEIAKESSKERKVLRSIS